MNSLLLAPKKLHQCGLFVVLQKNLLKAPLSLTFFLRFWEAEDKDTAGKTEKV